MSITNADRLFLEISALVEQALWDEGYFVCQIIEASYAIHILVIDSDSYRKFGSSQIMENISLFRGSYLIGCEGTTKHMELKLNRLIFEKIAQSYNKYVELNGDN